MDCKYFFISDTKRIKQQPFYGGYYKYTLQNKRWWGWSNIVYTYGEWAWNKKPIFKNIDEVVKYLLEQESDLDRVAVPLIK